MNSVVVLGVLAGAVTLVLGSVVLRAGKDRLDSRLFAATAALTGTTALLSCLEGGGGPSLQHLGTWSLGLGVEAITAALVLLFSYSFPEGRRPPGWLWALSVLVVGGGAGSAWMGGPWVRSMAPWWLLAPYAIAVVSLVVRALTLDRGAQRSGLALVAATFALRWLMFAGESASVSMWVSPDVAQTLPTLVVGGVILRYHLLDVRRVFREAAGALLAVFALAAYMALLAGHATDLQEMFGASATPLVVMLPPVVVVWALWTWRDSFGAVARSMDPHRSVRRELIERVLAVTGQVVDPEAVLSLIKAAMLEVFPDAGVTFWRVEDMKLLPGISKTAPEALARALRASDTGFVFASKLIEEHPELGTVWPEPGRRVLLPVRRDAVLYGAFELDSKGRIDGDELLTAAALADHLAVKLENRTLSSSLGEAGRELQNARSLVEDLIESLPVGIVAISGPDLRVRLWNPAEARRTGLAATEVLGKRYLDEVAAEHIAPAIADAIRKNPTDELSFPNVGWREETHGSSVDVTVAPLRSPGSSGYVLIMADTTERNALQHEVEESRRLAALGQFAAAIAHDIRTPLSSIRMSVQILRSKVSLPPEDMEYFDLTLEAISRLGRDVAELMDYTKPAFLRIEPVALGELIEDVCDVLAANAKVAKVRIASDVPEGLEVLVDELLLRKALVNLLDNAVEASPVGGEVRIEARVDADAVCMVVSDRGSGIAQEDRERIWDPFFTTRTDGTGLGLAIVRKAITAHGGTITVVSEPGAGTRFEIRLPATRATEVVVPIEECRREQERHRDQHSASDNANEAVASSLDA